MKIIIDRLKAEPAFLGGVLTALVGMVTAFGLALSGEQVGAITGFIGLLTGLGVRAKVSPANTTGGDQNDMPVEYDGPSGAFVDYPEV